MENPTSTRPHGEEAARNYNALIAGLDERNPGFDRMVSLLLDVLAVLERPDAELDELISRAISGLSVDQVSGELERRLLAFVGR